MNIYVVTRFSEELHKQISPAGASTSMGGALYLLYKALNNGYKEERWSMKDIEETLEACKEIVFNNIKYAIDKVELQEDI